MSQTKSTDAPPQKLLLAICVILVGCAANACVAAIVKTLSKHGLSTSMTLVGRNWVAWATVVPWVALAAPRNTFVSKIKTSRPILHLIRGIATFTALFLYYYSLRTLSLATGTLLFFTTPIFMPIVAYFWKKEVVPPRLWFAIGLGFLGILLVLKPGKDLFQLTSLVGLFSGIFATIGQFSIRELHPTEPSYRINFYYFLISGTGALIVSLFHPVANWGSLSSFHLTLFLWLGLLGSLWVLCLTIALKYAPPVFISSFMYFTIAFTIILDIWLWGIFPTLLSVIGFMLVVGAVVLKIILYPKGPQARPPHKRIEEIELE